MAEYVKVAKVGEVPTGQLKRVSVNGRAVALANIDGEFFAVDDVCTHAQCSLAGEGFLEGETVTCGCHGSQFDLKSGKVLSLPATLPVPTYPVKVEGNDILVAV